MWLITMVSFRPLNGVIPLINGLNGLEIGVTDHLLTGMILQEPSLKLTEKKLKIAVRLQTEKTIHLTTMNFQGGRYVHFQFVVEPTQLKNIYQNGSVPQIGVNIENIWNHHLDFILPAKKTIICWLDYKYILPPFTGIGKRLLKGCNPPNCNRNFHENPRFPHS